MRSDETLAEFGRRILYYADRYYPDPSATTQRIKEDWMRGVLIRGVLPTFREQCPTAVMAQTFDEARSLYKAVEINDMVNRGRVTKRAVGTRDTSQDPKRGNGSPKRVTWDASVRALQADPERHQEPRISIEEVQKIVRAENQDMANVVHQTHQAVIDKVEELQRTYRPPGYGNGSNHMVNEVRMGNSNQGPTICYYCGAAAHRWRNCHKRTQRFGPDPKETSTNTYYLPPYDLPFAPAYVREKIAQRDMKVEEVGNRYVGTTNRGTGNILETLQRRIGEVNSIEDLRRINFPNQEPELACNSVYNSGDERDLDYDGYEEDEAVGYYYCNLLTEGQIEEPMDQESIPSTTPSGDEKEDQTSFIIMRQGCTPKLYTEDPAWDANIMLHAINEIAFIMEQSMIGKRTDHTVSFTGPVYCRLQMSEVPPKDMVVFPPGDTELNAPPRKRQCSPTELNGDTLPRANQERLCTPTELLGVANQEGKEGPPSTPIELLGVADPESKDDPGASQELKPEAPPLPRRGRKSQQKKRKRIRNLKEWQKEHEREDALEQLAKQYTAYYIHVTEKPRKDRKPLEYRQMLQVFRKAGSPWDIKAYEIAQAIKATISKEQTPTERRLSLPIYGPYIGIENGSGPRVRRTSIDTLKTTHEIFAKHKHPETGETEVSLSELLELMDESDHEKRMIQVQVSKNPK